MNRVVVAVNNITLTESEFDAFKLFMQHYQNVQIMLRKGFFGMKNGSLTIHFDQNGAISSIVKNERVY